MTGDALPLGLDAFAEDDARTVVANVRRQAIARVTAALADAYVERLRSALDPHQTADRTDKTISSAGRGCYVYAVIEGDGTGAVTGQRGVQDAEIRLLPVEDLCALVSDVDLDHMAGLSTDAAVDDTSPLAVAVRAHDAVVDAAFRAGAVIPLRFGTVVTDDAAATEMLQAHAGTLRSELRRVAQAAEWSVRVTAMADVAVDEPAPAAVAATGRDYLTLLGHELQVRAESRRHADETAALVHDQLSALALDAVRGHGSAEGAPLLKATYLVRRDEAARFVARCDEMRTTLARQGMTLECTGPWPAYHFVDVRLEDAIR